MMQRWIGGGLALLLLSATPLAAQPRLSPAQLLNQGTVAYNQLPSVVGLEHAPVFSDAVRYLYAYEQRQYRAKADVGNDVWVRLNWLYDSLRDLRTGKADASRFRSNDALRERGLAAYRRVRASEYQGKIWDIEGFISASANLYAYVQCTSGPRQDARSAFAWLQSNRERLVQAGSKGDDPRVPSSPATWLPSEPKPETTLTATLLLTPQVLEATLSQQDSTPEPETEETTPNDEEAASPQLLQAYRKLQAEHEALQAAYQELERKYERLREAYDRDQRPLTADAPPEAERNQHYIKALDYLKAKAFPQARDAARRALRLDPGFGKAYLLLAQIYAEAAAMLGTNRPIDRAVYWLALDYLVQAHKAGIDARTVEEMGQRYAEQAPTARDKRVMGWTDGEIIQIQEEPYGWIGESVRVR